MNPEITNNKSTIKPPEAWQKLLCQSFRDTAIEPQKTGGCGLLTIRKFVYQSLQNSGIENRSPFSFRDLIRIRKQSKGNPQLVRSLCIESVLSMDSPSFCLLSSNAYFAILIIVLSLFTLLKPITATTFKPQQTSDSILKINIQPWADIEKEIISLPFNSDYLEAANTYKITAKEKQLEIINGAAWILDQHNSAYSLQVLSVSNKDNLLKFCKKHNICSESAFYTTQKNGKSLMRLIYGSFPSHYSAKLAKSKLPAALQKLSPWARSFKHIKSEL